PEQTTCELIRLVGSMLTTYQDGEDKWLVFIANSAMGFTGRTNSGYGILRRTQAGDGFEDGFAVTPLPNLPPLEPLAGAIRSAGALLLDLSPIPGRGNRFVGSGGNGILDIVLFDSILPGCSPLNICVQWTPERPVVYELELSTVTEPPVMEVVEAETVAPDLTPMFQMSNEFLAETFDTALVDMTRYHLVSVATAVSGQTMVSVLLPAYTVCQASPD